MSFNIGRVATGIATGGLSEAYNALKPKSVTQGQVPLETREQREARQMLNKFAKTGVFGKFRAGEDLGLELGDFNITPYEQTGLSSLEALLNSGIPEQYQMGDAALKDLLATSPAQIDNMFQPFKTQVQRQTRDAVDSAKRNSAYTGNLYSRSAIRDIGDVEARGNETLASELARLTDSALERRLRAVPLAYESGRQQEELQKGRVQASQVFGSLTRNLNDSRIKARDSEIIRRRQELGLPLQAATAVAGQNSNFGIPSITTQQPSELMQILQILGPAAGAFFGGRA